MVIGIDMLGVQSLGAAGRPSGRFGRQLVAALLARDPSRPFVLYAHEGLPVGAIPTARNARRVTLAPVAGMGCPRRGAVQRLLDLDPDGLDWLVLLDPFDAGFGGLPPESPIRGPRVASVVQDFDHGVVDDRRLAPIRRHDAILASTKASAADWRRRLGIAAGRVAPIGLASDTPFDRPDPAEPLSRVSAEELGRLGIAGPYLLAVGSDREGLAPILDAYRLLPVERRRGYQLVIAGPIGDPDTARSALRDFGSESGLVLASDLPETALATLHGRASAFLWTPGQPTLALAEALRSGTPVVAGRSPTSTEILGDAGLLVPTDDPAALTSALDEILSDPALDGELRRRSLARSARLGFGAIADAALATLGGPGGASMTRSRVDRGHAVRPRIAVFPAIPADGPGRLDLAVEVPPGWREAFGVDLYLEPGESARVDGLPPEFGGFDSRLFVRNDAILGYHAVVYRVADARSLDATLSRLRDRPGLVDLLDAACLDRVGPEEPEGGPDAPTARLRAILATGSRVAVHAPRHHDRIVASLPEFAHRIALVPPTEPGPGRLDDLRTRSRERLDLVPGSLVIGQFGRPCGSGSLLLTPRAFQAIGRVVPDLILLSFDSGHDATSARREAEALGIADRFVHVGPVTPPDAPEILSVLDLAIHPGESDSVDILELLKAGVATICFEASYPASVVRHVTPTPRGGELARAVRDLASDDVARAALGRSARSYCSGAPDDELASSLLVAEVDRCSRETPRAAGLPARSAGGPRSLFFTPHIAGHAPEAGELASRSR